MIRQKKTKIDIAVVGATGLVGQEFLRILQGRSFPIQNLRLFASRESSGNTVDFQGRQIKLEELSPGCFSGSDVAFFSAGAGISQEWAPVAVVEKCFVIDNSSAFRMKAGVPLVVPEVNADQIPSLEKPSIIANPNCSTIQLVVALKPLSDSYGLSQVIVSTYQSVSGAGKIGIDELKAHSMSFLNSQMNGDTKLHSEVFAHSVAFNNLPHIDVFDESGFTYEEKKVMDETRKIMSLPALDISVTAVRTPTFNGHSEAVWVDIGKEINRDEMVACLKAAPGVVVMDEPSEKLYPMNRDLSGRDEVFVGRIRRDPRNKKRWLMWIVSDNVRKGAALNGVQIAEKLFDL